MWEIGVSEFYGGYEPIASEDVLRMLRRTKDDAVADRRVSDVMRDLNDRIASPWPHGGI